MSVLKRILSYHGSLEFQALNDEEAEAGYQHKFVVRQYASYIRDKKVLDAGCWTGPIARAIQEAGIETELTGMDENESALAIARKNFSGFHFMQCQLINPDEAVSGS